jgi:hypothetical protein
MKELVRIASEEVALYFAQRRPRELAKFEWTIDAKDPRRITSQEKWWRETVAVWLESASRREPFIFVKDAGFNYKYFNRSFAMTKEMWFPDRPPEIMHDLRKMMSERMAFVDSRSETLQNFGARATSSRMKHGFMKYGYRLRVKTSLRFKMSKMVSSPNKQMEKI